MVELFITLKRSFGMEHTMKTHIYIFTFVCNMSVCVYSTDPCSGFNFKASKLSKTHMIHQHGHTSYREIVSLPEASNIPSMKNTLMRSTQSQQSLDSGIYAAPDRKRLACLTPPHASDTLQDINGRHCIVSQLCLLCLPQ